LNILSSAITSLFSSAKILNIPESQKQKVDFIPESPNFIIGIIPKSPILWQQLYQLQKVDTKTRCPASRQNNDIQTTKKSRTTM
jgi:hypothetical protein